MSSETQQRRRRGRYVLLSVAMVIGSACGDDTTLSTTGPQDTGSSTGGTSPSTVTLTTVDPTEAATSGLDTTDTASTGGDTTTGDTTTGDTTTGGETIPGQSVNQLVSAGGRAASSLYTVTYTFGQPSQLQSTHVSANYSIHGGLIGANGSPP